MEGSTGNFDVPSYPNASSLTAALFSVSTVASILAEFYTENRAADKVVFEETTEDTFDYIIVGAGTAGCVLANRLSANSENKVLLLEAGGDPHPLQSVPFFSLSLLNQPEIDWKFKAEPQPEACTGMHNKTCYWARGKGLGGSGSLNFMAYARGHPKDYDQWAELTGDERWGYENVLKYFLKSEDYHGDYSKAKEHANGGPIPVTSLLYTTAEKLAEVFVSAAEEIGYNRGDINSPFNESAFSAFENTITTDGKRASTYEKYLKTVMDRKNLFVFRYSHVLRVTLKSETENILTATGVEYERHGEQKIAFATKEVILSAGSIMSPHILKHSGIGDADELLIHNIETKLDLPGVGKNLQDHISSPVGPFTINKPFTLVPTRDITPESVDEYLVDGTGALAAAMTPATGLFTSSFAKADEMQEEWPDAQLTLFNVGMFHGATASLGYTLNIPRESLDPALDSGIQDAFLILAILNRPRSRGNISLPDNNPKSDPLIYAGYFTDDKGNDIKMLAEYYKAAVDIVLESEIFKALNASLVTADFPGCEKFTPGSDQFIECVIRELPLSIYDYVGTCKMGKLDDNEAVVDSEMKVIQTSNLRVIDGSIMPIITTGNTNAAIVMIAERGADLILDQEGNQNHL